MNICIMCQDFPPLIGGIAAHVYELSKALARQGNDVHVIVPKYPYNTKWEETLDGIHVHRVFQIRRHLLSGNLYILFGLLKLKSVIKEYGIDIIHYHSSYPESIITKFIKDKPIVFTLHDSGFLEMAEQKKYGKTLRFRLSHPDMIVGPSQELADIPLRFGVSSDRTLFISNGVDPDRFNPGINGDRIKKRYGISDDEIIVLCPRRLEPKNGVRYLIEAIPAIVKKSNKTRFMVVGEGGYKKERIEMEQRIGEFGLGSKVIFTGDIPNAEMPEFFAASDIVVLPSLMEATSIAGLEAMSSGKPLVGTTVGGIPQIIDEGVTGILIPPRDSERLANAIISLLADGALRKSMGKKARERVEKELSWDAIARKTLNVYMGLLK